MTRRANVGYPQTISEDPLILVYDAGDLETPRADDNMDVEVHTESGRWSATFMTPVNLQTLMEKNAKTGESAGGLYELLSADSIVVSEISADVIRRVVAALRSSGDFEYAFVLLKDD